MITFIVWIVHRYQATHVEIKAPTRHAAMRIFARGRMGNLGSLAKVRACVRT